MLESFTALRGMDQTYRGGIGSFPLLLMVVSFLRHRCQEGLPGARATGENYLGAGATGENQGAGAAGENWPRAGAAGEKQIVRPIVHSLVKKR